MHFKCIYRYITELMFELSTLLYNLTFWELDDNLIQLMWSIIID